MTALELYDHELNRHFSYFIAGAITLQQFKAAMAETFEQVKQTVRQRIIDAHIEGQPFYSCQSEKAEQYYKQTYESKDTAQTP